MDTTTDGRMLELICM